MSAARTPGRRTWERFKRNRVGYCSFWAFMALLAVALLSPLLANEAPLAAHYEGKTYFPIFFDYPETQFGGDFLTPVDWYDPFIHAQFKKEGNWAVFTLIQYSPNSVNYTDYQSHPAPRRESTGSAPIRTVATSWRVCCSALPSVSYLPSL